MLLYARRVTLQEDPADGETDSSPSLEDLEGRAVRASILTAIQAVVGLPLAFVANLLVARWLGPHGYGQVATYMAEFSIIIVVLNGGVSDATIQWGAAAYGRGDAAQLRALARRCSGYHLVVEGPLGAAAALVLLRHEDLATQLVGALAVGLTMALGTAVVMMTALSRTGVLAKQALLVNVALQAAIVLTAFQTHDPGKVWVARLAVGSLTVLWPVVLVPRDVRAAIFRPALPIRWPEGFARYAGGTLVAGLVTTLVFSRCELLVLDAYGQTTAAGLYALAAGLASQLTAPVDAMLGPLVPATASLTAVSPDRVESAIRRGVGVSTLAVLPLLLVAVPVVALLVRLIYGEAYTSTAAPFVVLAVVSCVQSALHPVTAFIGAMRRPGLVLMVNTAALAVDLAVVVVAARWWGLWAAVVANALGQLVSLTVLSIVLARRYEFRFGRIAGALVPALLIGGWSAGLAAAALAVPGALAVRIVVVALIGPVVGWVLVRSIGGVITAADLASLQRSLPRRLALLVGALSRLGLVSRVRTAG